MSKDDEILKSIEKLDGKVESLACQNDEIRELEAKLVTLSKAVFGNGDLTGGLVGRMLLMQKWVDNRVWYERALMISVIAEAVGLVFMLINTNALKGETIVWIIGNHLVKFLMNIL